MVCLALGCGDAFQQQRKESGQNWGQDAWVILEEYVLESVRNLRLGKGSPSNTEDQDLERSDLNTIVNL